MDTLLEGDANNDNHIEIRDISLLAAAYGKQQGEPGFDPRADFNEDGEANAQDLELLQPNLRRRGDVLVGISPSASLRAGAASAAEEPLELFIPKETLAAGSVSLRLVPQTDVTVGPGSLVELIRPDRVRLLRGEIKVTATGKSPLELIGLSRAEIEVD